MERGLLRALVLIAVSVAFVYGGVDLTADPESFSSPSSSNASSSTSNSSRSGSSGAGDEDAGLNSRGNEFIIMYQNNEGRRPNREFDLQLFLATQSETPVNAEVTMPLYTEKGEIKHNVVIKRGEVTEINLPQDAAQFLAGKSTRGIHITADGELAVYGINPQRFSSEGFLGLPVAGLGTEYYAIAMPAETEHSQLGVVATENNTKVEVTLPSGDATLSVSAGDRSYGPGEKVEVTLNKYETFQMQHKNRQRGLTTGDISGARITCDKPCAAFSGNSRTSVSGASRDHLVEQLPPTQSWGRKFAVPPTPERTDRPDILKIVCQQNGTIVKIDGEESTCDRSGTIQVEITTDMVHLVEATKPILAATVVMSQAGGRSMVKADPAMTLVLPEEQYDTDYTIAPARMSGTEEYENFITIVIRQNELAELRIDGELLSDKFPQADWKVIPNTNENGQDPLVSTHLPISAGDHTIDSAQRNARFMLMVYGAGDRESYGYLGGMRLNAINTPCEQAADPKPDDGIDNDCDSKIDEEVCDGIDDDGDGAIDEDCSSKDKITGEVSKHIFQSNGTSLSWTVYASDWATNKGLELVKTQPTGEPVVLAETDAAGALVLREPFAERYSVVTGEPLTQGNMTTLNVTLNIDDGKVADIGVYDLQYESATGNISAVSNLNVRSPPQTYELVANSSMASSDEEQMVNSADSTREFNLTNGGDYKLFFRSYGGTHPSELPYKVYMNNRDVTSSFKVNGVTMKDLEGDIPGLQDVVYYFEMEHDGYWTANTDFDGKLWEVTKNDATTAIDAKLNVVEGPTTTTVVPETEVNDTSTGPTLTSDIEQEGSEIVITVNIQNQPDPAEHTYSWNVPISSAGQMVDLSAGSSNTMYKASNPEVLPDGSVQLTLTTDPTTYNREVRFQTDSEEDNGDVVWTGNANFQLASAQPAEPELTTSVNAQDSGRVDLIVYLTNQDTADTHSYKWEVKDNNGNTLHEIVPGGDEEGYSAQTPKVLNDGRTELTLTANASGDAINVHFMSNSTRRGQADPFYQGSALFKLNPPGNAPRLIPEVRPNENGTTDLIVLTENEGPEPNSSWTVMDNDESVYVLPVGETNDFVTNNSVSTLPDGKNEYTITLADPTALSEARFDQVYRYPDNRTSTSNVIFVNSRENVIGTDTNVSPVVGAVDEESSPDKPSTNPTGRPDASFTTVIPPPGPGELPLTVINPTNDVTKCEGQSLSLSCNLQSELPINKDSIKWYKTMPGGETKVEISRGNQLLEPFISTKRHSIYTAVSGGTMDSNLAVSSVDGSDAGNYTCYYMDASNNVIVNKFNADVISQSMLLNNKPFDGQNSPVCEDVDYSLSLVINSQRKPTLMILIGSTPRTHEFQESDPVPVTMNDANGQEYTTNQYTFVLDGFKPTSHIIQTMFLTAKREWKPIETYSLLQDCEKAAEAEEAKGMVSVGSDCSVHNGMCQQNCDAVTQSCSCNEGFVLAANGFTCDDIDECKASPSPCGADESCVNTAGSYVCLPTCGCPGGNADVQDSRRKRSIDYEYSSQYQQSYVSPLALLSWLISLTIAIIFAYVIMAFVHRRNHSVSKVDA